MRIYLGIGLRLTAALCFVIMAGLVKVAGDMAIGQVLFARSVVIVPVMLAFLAARRRLADLRTSRPGGHLVRSVLGCGALLFWFLALRYLPLPDVTALLYLSPVLTVILGALLLKEAVSPHRLGAVALGLVGMLVIMAPQIGGHYDQSALIGIGLCLLNTICFSLSVVQIRQLTATESTVAIVFYFSLFSSILTAFSLPWGWVWPNLEQWGILIGIGALGGSGQLLLTACYRYAPVSVIAPFEYSTLLWAMLIGALFFGEFPAAATIAGAVLIGAAGLAVAHRENTLGMERAMQEKPL